MKGKILILLCLLASLGGGSTVSAAGGYSYEQITKLEDIKFDGTTKYAFQMVAAEYDSDLLNRFLRYGIATNGSIQVVGLGLASSSGHTTISAICDDMTQEEGKRYAFTLSGSAASCIAKNYDNTVWGNAGGNYDNRPGGVSEENAIPLTLGAGKTTNTFRISMNGNTLRVLSKTSPYVSYKYASWQPRYVDFKIYEIIEPVASTNVTYYFYDSKGTKIKQAEHTDFAESTISGLAGLPNYVTATYYTDAEMKTPVVNTSVAPTAGAIYYVQTDYISGMPFDLNGNYFCLGYSGEESFQTSTNLSGKPSVAKYAIKMSGNWADKFALQDINGYFLGNTADNKTFSSTNSNASKFDIDYYEYFGYKYFVLKSMANDKFIYLNSDGSISYVDNKNYATTLNNLTTDQVSIFLENCPAERYVGAYSRTQKDEGLSLNDILNGNRKVAYNPNRYYYLEAVDNSGYVLTAQESSQNLKDGIINYVVNIANSNDFAGLWSLKNSFLTHVNTKKDMNVNGQLGNGFGYLAYSSVDGKSEPYQAFTIKLTQSSTATYLSRTGDNSLEMVTTKPDTKEGFWYLREASSYTIPLNDVGGEAYATLCAPVDLKFSVNDYGTTAYTGELTTEIIDGKEVKVLDLTEVNRESVIAAGTPLVLYYPYSGNVVSVFDVVYDASVSYSPNDTWKGTFINLVFGNDEATAKNYRTLGKGGAANTAGFYTPRATTKIPANRAYIEMPSASETQAMLPIRFDDGTLTWIDASILTGEQTDNAAIYDLSGRRIMQPQRGQLYIRGGKKFIAQ